MVGERTKATLFALTLVVGFAAAPGFALADSNDAPTVAGPVADVAQEGDGEGDGANTTLQNLTVETMTLENVTIENAMIAQATVGDEERTNLTTDSLTVENATLTNVTFQNITMTDRELLTAVVGQARATPEQNNSLESLDVSDRTIDGLVIHEATVQDASGIQLGEADDGGTEQAEQATADDADLVVENVTVESITQDATDAGAEDGTDTETEVDADDGSSDETETEAGDE